MGSEVSDGIILSIFVTGNTVLLARLSFSTEYVKFSNLGKNCRQMLFTLLQKGSLVQVSTVVVIFLAKPNSVNLQPI
jgi:hypothetical protein